MSSANKIRHRDQTEMELVDMFSLRFKVLWQALRQEHLSLWMLCFYFFFEYVRPQVIYPALDILPWGQVFLLGSLTTAFSDRSVIWVDNIINKLFVFFIFIIILSGIFAFRPAMSLGYWEVMFGWLVVYFLVISVVNTEKRLLLFLLAYCLFNLKMAQHGAMSWAMRGFSFADYGLIGAPGWFSNSGEYAIQMLIFGPLALALVFSLKGHWGKYKKLFFYLCAITAFMAVIGSSSRGGQIGLAVIGAWFLLKQDNGFKGLLIISFLVFVLYNLLPEEQLMRFEEMGDDKNSLQRLAYWSYGLNEVIPNNLLFGLGYHNWLSYLNFAAPEGMGPMQRNQESHNIYIQAAAELGIPGLLVFLLMALFAFINNARSRTLLKNLNTPWLFNLTYALDAGLIGFLVAGNFVTVLYYPFFWMQVAMIVMLNNVVRKKVKVIRKTPKFVAS